MKEHKLFKDLPSRGKYHSCIISSFSFDYHFFDAQIRRQLHSKEIYNIVLLSDAYVMEQSFGVLSLGTQHFQNDYTLTSIDSPGVFHPKIALFFGEKEVMMHLGSGNLTPGGLGKNHELFSTFSTNDRTDPQFAIIQSALAYLTSFLSEKTGFVQQQLSWIRKECQLVKDFKILAGTEPVELDGKTTVAFLFNGDSSIYEQLKSRISFPEVTDIKIISPFYDTNGAFLTRLMRDCPNASINLFVQDGRTVLPDPIPTDNKISYFDWSKTKRGKKNPSSGERFNHSKAFVFQTPEHTYLLHGSPNATSAAFGLHTRFMNEEAALLYQYPSPEVVPDFGFSHYIQLAPESLKSGSYLPSPEEAVQKKRKSVIAILGADKYANKIHIQCSKAISNLQHLVFLNAAGKTIESISGSDLKKEEINRF